MSRKFAMEFVLAIFLMAHGLVFSFPVVCGNLGQFTFTDAIFYLRKLIFGTISRPYEENYQAELPDLACAITITALGDLMYSRGLVIAGDPYSSVEKSLFQSEIVFANLEFPIDTRFPESAFPKFNGSFEYFEKVVTPLGINVMNIANNHSLDRGIEGLRSTRTFLNDRGIHCVGFGEESRFSIIPFDKVRIAVSGFTFGTNGATVDSESSLNVANLNTFEDAETALSKIIPIVESMSEEASVIVLSLHWGLEFENKPTEMQVEVARKLCDEGVDLIIGHHPHVLQPLEVYLNARGSTSLIIYSLGNWISSMKAKDCRITASLKIELSEDGSVCGIKVFPYFFNLSKMQLVPLSNPALIPESFAYYLDSSPNCSH
ncbi:CapA family protein [Mesotoga sp. H07.pep.5.3]|uniref:CapA family protein n=1 Tax=Mesotoga sp. H07.pep.5.3 TaxID=1421003 RepID=UPI000C1811A8|nr:CapA family protein [Mesotoga sp. H07.pep.5.3]PIJ62138.1 capsule biosynthesis protein CapA [Mesotoga sp. H07.pep.5.3]